MYGCYELVIWVADITLYFLDSCLGAVRTFPSGGVRRANRCSSVGERK